MTAAAHAQQVAAALELVIAVSQGPRTAAAQVLEILAAAANWKKKKQLSRRTDGNSWALGSGGSVVLGG